MVHEALYQIINKDSPVKLESCVLFDSLPVRHYALTKQEASEKNLSSGFGVKLRSFTSAVKMFPGLRIALNLSGRTSFLLKAVRRSFQCDDDDMS